MENLIIFSSEVLLCFGISITLMRQLKPKLKDILNEVCGSEIRAAF